MAPLAFSFTGIKVYLYYEDHDPIHIHAKYAEYESIYELHFENGKLSDVKKRKADFEHLPSAQDKKVRKFIKKYYKEITEKWTEIVVLKKKISLTQIKDI